MLKKGWQQPRLATIGNHLKNVTEVSISIVATGQQKDKMLGDKDKKAMPILTTGKKLIRDLEKSSALGVYVPLEGGFEGRYRRRLRAAGYITLHMSARGLGDLSAYLTGVHGVRPPHLGKKDIGQGAAVGYVYYVPPIVNYQLTQLPPNSKGLVLWIIEGHILSNQEVEFLANLPSLEPRVKVVLERGGDRYFRWLPLTKTLASSYQSA